MAKESDLLLTKTSKKMKSNKTNNRMTTTLNGLMTFGETDNGLKMLDFMCTEGVEMEPFAATCRVQGMHTGDVYIVERPKKERNTPLFREENSTLTLGRDGKYYFYFSLPESQVKVLPEALVHQALSIAQKVERIVLRKKGRKGLVENRNN